jgi:hypothetical protein
VSSIADKGVDVVNAEKELLGLLAAFAFPAVSSKHLQASLLTSLALIFNTSEPLSRIPSILLGVEGDKPTSLATSLLPAAHTRTAWGNFGWAV